MSKLLINEPPLQVLPTLAKEIGLNEAIALQQLHYWLNHGIWHKGSKWIYKPIHKWQQQDFPFWSERTVRNVFNSLKKQNLISVEKLNSNKQVRVNYYSINKSELKKITDRLDKVNKTNDWAILADCIWQHLPLPFGKSYHFHSVKLTNCMWQEVPNVKETNKESKKETNKDIGKKPHSIPDDFKPTDKQIEKMETYGINADLLLDSFINGSKANGKKYKCWNSAFSTWINNEIKWSNLKPVEQQPTHPSYKPFEQEKSSLSIEEQRQALLSVMGGDI